MSDKEEKGTERLTNAMCMDNLADRLNAKIMTGTSIPLKLESNATASENPPDEPPKQ